jgi:hypothetical protein
VTTIDVEEEVPVPFKSLTSVQMAKAVAEEAEANRKAQRAELLAEQQDAASKLRTALAMVDGIISEHCSRHQCNRYVYLIYTSSPKLIHAHTQHK